MLNATRVLALVIVTGLTHGAFGQECPGSNAAAPNTASQARTLEGQLVYHDGIRQWFELKLDEPQCGQASIQLLEMDSSAEDLETLRGCRVRSRGRLDYATTGYITLDVFQDVSAMEPVGACVRQPRFPDFTAARPDPSIRAYRVDMQIDYGPGDHPVRFEVQGAGRKLEPWQAYASYMLTGGFALYGYCAEGFVTDTVFGTPAAQPSHFGDPRTPWDWAAFDPETAASNGVWNLQLGYTCIRDPADPER